LILFCSVTFKRVLILFKSFHLFFFLYLNKILCLTNCVCLDLENLHTQHPIPWCFIGDFNYILGAHEHRGNTTPARPPMNDFVLWTNQNNFTHLPTRGAQFTWSNGRKGRRHTERRLDRAICNNLWLDMCSSINVSTLTKQNSDHFPLLIEFQTSEVHFASQFRFMQMWTQHPDCMQLVERIWNTVVHGTPMFILSHKLKLLKEKFKVWNKEVFGNVHNLVQNAEVKLNVIQLAIDTHGQSDFLFDQQKHAQIDLNKALDMEEVFWREKSRVKWHLEGDRNTRYFHRLTKIKNSTKTISSIRNGDDIITDPDLIASHLTNHFQNIFCNSSVLQVNNLVEDCVPELINDHTNNLLTLLPTEKEIHDAVLAFNRDSAPGPDGFGAIFFHTYWNIVKMDVIKAMQEFFTTGKLLNNFNSNTIVLIPKNSNADTVNQYRPIALANFKFKIISKILADRLAPIMPHIILEEQRGFIKGRNIKDCICLTSEAVNLLNKKAFGGNMACKIDISKAFDTLDWSFLMQVLLKFGFNTKFCSWILTILESAKLSVSVNGKQHGFFSCKRGVRQGDPLSPLLFCIAEDVLNRSISKLVMNGKVELIKASRNQCVPSHILYADDVMIFCKAKLSCIQALKNLFIQYAKCSGQVINPSKSTIYAGSISNSRLLHLSQK